MKNNIILSLLFVAFLNIHCSVNNYYKINKTVEQSQVFPSNFKQEIRFDISQNNVILKVKIQGKDYNFMLNSYSNFCALDTELAATLQLKNQFKIPNNDDENEAYSFAELEKISIGNLNFSKVICAIDDLNCNSCNNCAHIDGIIGTNLMAKAIWQINYPNNKITITSHQDSLSLNKNKKTINFHTDYGYLMGKPIVALSVNYNYICDAAVGTSGCNKIRLHSSLVKRISNSTQTYQGYYLKNAALGNQRDTFKNYLVPNLTIGDDLNLTNLIVWSYKYERSSIGYDFLKNYSVTLDWKKQQISLYKMKEESFDTYGYYINYADNKVIVCTLFQNSPAEKAGLKLNDHIIKINDQDLSNPTQQDFCQLKDPYLNDKIQLTVKRGNEILEMTIPKIDERTLFNKL